MVLDAFTEGRPAQSKRFTTDGVTLDGNWLGGKGLATRSANGKISFQDNGSKTQEVVERALRKMAPKSYFASSHKRASSEVELVAVPLDGSDAQYFSNNEEFSEVLDGFRAKNLEEWEIQVVNAPYPKDGLGPDVISRILGNYPHPDLVERLLEEVPDWDFTKWVLAIHAAKHSGLRGADILDAVDSDDIHVHSGDLKDYAKELVSDIGNPDKDRQGMYFDFEAYGIDAAAEGDVPDEFVELEGKELGLALIEDLYGSEPIPDELYMEYFDYPGFAADIRTDGNAHEYNIEGEKFVVVDMS